MLRNFLIAVFSVLVTASAHAQVGVGDPEPMTHEECVAAADAWRDGAIDDLIDADLMRRDAITQERRDALRDAEAAFSAAVADCLDFWCISAALDQYNADVQAANDAYNQAMDDWGEEYQILMLWIQQQHAQRVADCNCPDDGLS